MVPLSLSFRKLLLRNIPDLTTGVLNRYDSLLALRFEYIHRSRRNTLPPVIDVDTTDVSKTSGGEPTTPSAKPEQPRHELIPSKTSPPASSAFASRQENIIDVIKLLSEETHATIRPFQTRFEALHRLWLSRRRVANQIGNLQPIPVTRKGLENLGSAIKDYQKAQVETATTLVIESIKDILDGVKCLCLCAVGRKTYHHLPWRYCFHRRLRKVSRDTKKLK